MLDPPKPFSSPIWIHHWPASDSRGPTDWGNARQFATLDDAIRAVRERPAPMGMSPWALSGDGRRISPTELGILSIKRPDSSGSAP